MTASSFHQSALKASHATADWAAASHDHHPHEARVCVCVSYTTGVTELIQVSVWSSHRSITSPTLSGVEQLLTLTPPASSRDQELCLQRPDSSPAETELHFINTWLLLQVDDVDLRSLKLLSHINTFNLLHLQVKQDYKSGVVLQHSLHSRKLRSWRDVLCPHLLVLWLVTCISCFLCDTWRSEASEPITAL